MFGKLDNLLKKLNEYRPLQKEKVKGLEMNFYRLTYNSNAIEGNTLTLQETALVLQEGITIDKTTERAFEVIGHMKHFLYRRDGKEKNFYQRIL